jgi:hypothetical protein
LRSIETRIACLMTLGNSLVLGITQGKETTFYRLERLASDFGAAWRLSKADNGDGPREVYDVCLLDGGRSTCECAGMLRWGHRHPCRHIASLARLQKLGKLDASKPVMTNAEEPMGRVLLGGESHRQEMATQPVELDDF